MNKRDYYEILGCLYVNNNKKLITALTLESVLKLNDTSATMRAISLIRGFVMPKGMNNDPALKARTAAEARHRIAEYYYEDIKKRLSKGKKVDEQELNFRKKDLEDAAKALFKVEGSLTTAKYKKCKTPFKTLEKNKVPLTEDERKEVMDAEATWNHGPDGEPTPAVWKSVDKTTGEVTFVTHTHRAFNTSPTLKGAINRYHTFIKTTAATKVKISNPKIVKVKDNQRYTWDRRRKFTWVLVEYKGDDGYEYRKAFNFEAGMSSKEMDALIPKEGYLEAITKIAQTPFHVKSNTVEALFKIKVSLKQAKKGSYIDAVINGVSYGYVAPKDYRGGTDKLFKDLGKKMLHDSHGSALQWLKETAIPLGKVSDWNNK